MVTEGALERPVRLGFPYVAKEYASKKNLLDVLTRLEEPSRADAAEPASAGRPQFLALIAGLVLVWLGTTMFFRELRLVIGDLDVLFATMGDWWRASPFSWLRAPCSLR